MELRQLKYFVKLAELLNYSEAAKALYISQSTLSQQIKQLENELNCQLLERNSHTVTLTDNGKVLLDEAMKTIDHANACIDRINDVRNLQSGTLNIGATYTFSPIISESVLQYMKKYPHIKLNIFCKSMEELIVMLQRQEVDFVLSYKPDGHYENIDSHVLFENKLCVVVNNEHPLARKESVTPMELQKYKFALPSKGMQARNTLDAILDEKDIELNISLEINDISILLGLVQKSSLATFVSRASIPEHCNLAAIPLDSSNCEMEGCVHLAKGRYVKKATKEFIEMLTETDSIIMMRHKWFEDIH